MTSHTSYIFLYLFGFLFFHTISNAQEINGQPTDDLGNVSDAFQESFFEALKQKGIQNYELALEALEKAERAAEENEENKAVVYFEMAKNLSKLERYPEAESYYDKVLTWDSSRVDVMESMYDMYYNQKNYNAAIPLVKKLIVYDEDYKEDLANLYHRTKQYDEALVILDELDKEWGESNYRNALRSQIYRVTGNTSKEIDNLEEKIESNPKNENEYLKLIYLYSEEGDTEKAFQTAKELLQQKPNSKLVHLALYKFYLDKGEHDEAIKSMEIVVASSEIEYDSKLRVLEDFLKFTHQNPSYKKDIENISKFFLEQENATAFMLIGDFYLSENNKEQALQYYLTGIEKDAQNFGLLKNTLLLQIDLKHYKEALSLSNSGLDDFPAQPLLYLLNGVANNYLEQSNDAIEVLETGLDYLFDDPKMEYDFYKQLVISYTEKGDSQKVEMYQQRATELNITN